jgi:predicted nuclease of predicted toxin-antitoxin system
MKLKTDENLPVEVALALQKAGHDATTVREQRLSGRSDQDVAAVCRNEGRILVTLDTDFANIQRYPPSQFPGLIVLRLGHQDKPYVLGLMPTIVSLLEHEPIDGHLWIVEEGRIRVRE